MKTIKVLSFVFSGFFTVLIGAGMAYSGQIDLWNDASDQVYDFKGPEEILKNQMMMKKFREMVLNQKAPVSKDNDTESCFLNDLPKVASANFPSANAVFVADNSHSSASYSCSAPVSANAVASAGASNGFAIGENQTFLVATDPGSHAGVSTPNVRMETRQSVLASNDTYEITNPGGDPDGPPIGEVPVGDGVLVMLCLIAVYGYVLYVNKRKANKEFCE